MANPVLTVALTAEQWTAAQAAVQQQCGVTLAGNAGDAEKDGVVMRYAWDGSTLTVTVVSRKFYDPSVDAIDAQVMAALQTITAHPANG